MFMFVKKHSKRAWVNESQIRQENALLSICSNRIPQQGNKVITTSINQSSARKKEANRTGKIWQKQGRTNQQLVPLKLEN